MIHPVQSMRRWLTSRRLSQTDVRNTVRIEFTASVTGARMAVEVSDLSSIKGRGRLPMEIHEARLGPIDDVAKAARFAESALEDLRKEQYDA